MIDIADCMARLDLLEKRFEELHHMFDTYNARLDSIENKIDVMLNLLRQSANNLPT